MKDLALILEELFITESFKSPTLSKIWNVVKKSRHGSGMSKSDFNNQFLPRGIAWDKIEESEIIPGESMNPSFIKKYASNEDYFIFWFPLMSYKYNPSKNQTYTIAPGTIVITCGTKFVNYKSGIYCWTIEPIMDKEYFRIINPNKKGLSPEEYEKYIDKIYNDEKHKHSNNAVNPDSRVYGYNERNNEDIYNVAYGTFTFNRLTEQCYAAAVAISKETIAKYDTRDKMRSREDARTGAIAFTRKDEVNWHKKTNGYYDKNCEWHAPHDKKLPTYYKVKRSNIEKYKNILAQRTSDETLNIFKDKIIKFRSAYEEYSKLLATSGYKNQVDDYIMNKGTQEFIDIYFNKVSDQTDDQVVFQTYMDDLLSGINSIVDGVVSLAQLRDDHAGLTGGQLEKNEKRQTDWKKVISEHVKNCDKCVANLELLSKNMR